MKNVLQKFNETYDREKREDMTVEEFLTRAKTDNGCYATAPERMIKAIGEPEIVDSSKDIRLQRIFQNRSFKRYKTFEDFYGIEEVIEKLVGYFVHAAQGLEESKQILYLLGPVGAAKSSLAERIKYLMEKLPIYVLKFGDELSPVFESPLGLFNQEQHGAILETEYNIPQRYLTGILSPWAVKRLDQAGGDITKFSVVKLYPSKMRQIAIAKTEPGDENTQDISSLVGKVDLRKLDKYAQNDADAYSFSGALCRGNQGVLEFVEMFKAPIKTLHPLLTATQERNYVGTEEIGAIPFNGIVLAHSNQSEWDIFKGNKNNEAFLDRVYVVKVPYCLRVAEEVMIYRKMLDSSSLRGAPVAPHTLEMMAQFSVLSRLKDPANATWVAKMRVYNGENITDTEMNAKTISEYQDAAGVDEGMDGLSTRFAFKLLSKVYNFDTEEVSADPVHLIQVLMQTIKQEQFGTTVTDKYMMFVREFLSKKYAELVGKEIQEAYMESYSSYGQSEFDKYFLYSDHWMDNNDYKDPDTGILMSRDALHDELVKIEVPAGVANYKDFRAEVVKWIVKAQARNGGKIPDWRSYSKLKEVIEKKIFSTTEDLLPIISFTSKRNSDDDKKHHEFVDRMLAKRIDEVTRYTERMIRRVVEWHMRFQKSG